MDLKCEYCGKECSSKSGLTLHLQRCTKIPKPAPESPPETLETPPDPATPETKLHSELNQKLITAVKGRNFTKDELSQLNDIISEKMKENEGELFKLDNGEIVKIRDKIVLAKRSLMLAKKLDQPEVLHTSECEKCGGKTNVRVGSEPRGPNKSTIHLYCYKCDQWTEQQMN